MAWLRWHLTESTELLHQLHNSENGCGSSTQALLLHWTGHSVVLIALANTCLYEFVIFFLILEVLPVVWLFGLPLGKPEADRLKTPIGAN